MSILRRLTSSIVRTARRGFTIVECIIAFTIITTVGIVTLSIVQATTAYEAKLSDYTEMRQLADNALECFRYSDSADEFAEAMNIYHTTADIQPAQTNGYDLYIYTCSHCRLEIRVDYTGERPAYSAICTNTAGQEMYSIDYEGT